MVKVSTSPAVERDLQVVGDALRRWRMVRELPAAVVADRARISQTTLRSLERGDPGVRLATLLEVMRVLGVEQPILAAFEPLNTEIGRARADRMVRKRAPR